MWKHFFVEYNATVLENCPWPSNGPIPTHKHIILFSKVLSSSQVKMLLKRYNCLSRKITSLPVLYTEIFYNPLVESMHPVHQYKRVFNTLIGAKVRWVAFLNSYIFMEHISICSIKLISLVSAFSRHRSYKTFASISTTTFTNLNHGWPLAKRAKYWLMHPS